MIRDKELKQELENYIQIAVTGHYPLFFEEWLNLNQDNSKRINYRAANANVNKVFEDLKKHRSVEKKKTALIGMSNERRVEFIHSFLKVVEHECLKEDYKLQ